MEPHIDSVAAYERIRPYIRRTPLEFSPTLSTAVDAECWLKLELWQETGSFKLRGATNRLLQLTDEERVRGIVTASAGNHALGIAHAASRMQIPATIIVPLDASPAKVAHLRQYDPQWITLRPMGADYDAAERWGIAFAQEHDLPFISPYNDPEVIAGQGTLGIELLQDLPDVQTVIVPVGGGGLAAGVALALHTQRPDIAVVGVQSEASPAMAAALTAGKLVEVPIGASLADGLAGNVEPGSITFALCQHELARIALVSEEAIGRSMAWLADEHQLLAEGSAAVAVAALQQGVVTVPQGSKVAVLLCGRNVGPHVIRQVLGRYS